MQSIPTFDLYRELEVDPAASVETIEAAWKSLLKRNHPDLVADKAAAHERVKRLNLAHEWLADPARRAAYDAARPRPRQPTIRPRTPIVVRPAPAASPDAASGPPPADATGGFAPGGPAGPTAGSSSGFNPYADYPSPDEHRRFGTTPSGGAGPARAPAPAQRRSSGIPAVLLPVVIVSVMAVVGVSALMGATRGEPSVAVATRPAASSGLAASASSPGASGASVSGAYGDLRAMPELAYASDLPATCRHPVDRPLTFDLTANIQARVVVAKCDQAHSAGPLVYQAGTDGRWHLVAKLGLRDGDATQGFAGSVSGRSPDEFGLAWTHPNGTTSTLSLYRIAGSSLEEYWDSADIGLGWWLPTFSFVERGAAADPGAVSVVSAKPGTGTASCASCADHEMTRQLYTWDTGGPAPALRPVGSPEAAGTGP